jgi:hypothetical protein
MCFDIFSEFESTQGDSEPLMVGVTTGMPRARGFGTASSWRINTAKKDLFEAVKDTFCSFWLQYKTQLTMTFMRWCVGVS